MSRTINNPKQKVTNLSRLKLFRLFLFYFHTFWSRLVEAVWELSWTFNLSFSFFLKSISCHFFRTNFLQKLDWETRILIVRLLLSPQKLRKTWFWFVWDMNLNIFSTHEFSIPFDLGFRFFDLYRHVSCLLLSRKWQKWKWKNLSHQNSFSNYKLASILICWTWDTCKRR